MATTILAFPPRGGTGFSIPAKTKYKQLDITNLCSLNLARSIKAERQHYPDERDFSFERTPEMLICMALFKAMPTEQRARAMMTVNQTYMSCCDEDSRIAGNILAAVSLAENK